jgi:hypothetical protein
MDPRQKLRSRRSKPQLKEPDAASSVCADDSTPHLSFPMGSVMADNPTISQDYLALQRELHKNPNYGVASLAYAPTVASLMQQASLRSLSDYGAGKCNLHKALQESGVKGYEYYHYDPVFPEYGPPKPADLVCCIDVLEHIEIDYLERVLLDLEGITRKLGFFSVHTEPAAKVLADGRNAHLIQQPASWWLPKLCMHFEIGHLQRAPGGFWVIAEPLAGARSG